MIEEDIQKSEMEIIEIEKLIQDFASDYQKLTDLTEQRQSIKDNLEKLYRNWMDMTNE